MNKKGFTLVELLAVIAILAVLVVLALPNIMGMFKDAKKKSFLTEAQTIYKEATKKYITESTKGNNVNTISSSGENKLSMNGSNNLNYCVILDNKGKPTKMAISKGGYFIIKKNLKDVTSLEDSDIHEGTLNIPSCSESSFKSITGTTTDNETVTSSKVPENKCIYDGELVPGATYINDQYTYCYKCIFHPLNRIMYTLEADYPEWAKNALEKGLETYASGWSMTLTNKNSTTAVSSKMCTSINDIPITNMMYAFAGSQASSIDVSSFDTSEVTGMMGMFAFSEAEIITGLENFDTSNLSDEAYMSENPYFDMGFGAVEIMFAGSKATTLDLSSFDTSNVTKMDYMFQDSFATTGYAKTQADADRFNSSSNKPTNLNFVVKTD